METQVVITGVTQMGGNHVCVSAYSLDCGWIRPVLDNKPFDEAWLRFDDGRVAIRPFAIVDFDLLEQERRVQPPHTEDRVIAARYRAYPVLRETDRFDFLRNVADQDVSTIFDARINHVPGQGLWINYGDGSRSLGVIEAEKINKVSYWKKTEEDKWIYHLSFTDRAGDSYDLAVTDLAFRYYLDYKRERSSDPTRVAQSVTSALQNDPERTFIRIGLARRWDKYPDRCYLQVTGIFTFPDYLKGCCFADYAPRPPRPYDDVPF